MSDLGYGEGYRYAHDYPGHFVEQEYLPSSLRSQRFWLSDEGNASEAKMMERQRSRWQGRFTPPTEPEK